MKNDFVSNIERVQEISEIVGRIDLLNEQLDELLTRQNNLQMNLLEINIGLDEVKRVYGL